MRGIAIRLFALALALCAGLTACDSREHCDAALDVICSCASRPCEAEEPPAIVRAMRRCDEDDVRPDDQEGNVHICIVEAGSDFCAVLDGVTEPGPALCRADCDLYEAACTTALERACTDYQFNTCDVPTGAEVSQ